MGLRCVAGVVRAPASRLVEVSVGPEHHLEHRHRGVGA